MRNGRRFTVVRMYVAGIAIATALGLGTAVQAPVFAQQIPGTVFCGTCRFFYRGVWQGRIVYLAHMPNYSVEAGGRLVGQITNFQTNDPYYASLRGRTINVFVDDGRYPNDLVVHPGLQGPQPVYGTWVFSNWF